MDSLLRTLKAVLWASIGLGGRRADAEQRTRGVGVVPLLVVGLVLTVLLVVALIAVARFAAGT